MYRKCKVGFRDWGLGVQRFRAGIKPDPIRTRESDLYQGRGTKKKKKKKTIMTHVLPNAIAYLCLALTLDLRYSVYEQVVLSQGSKLLRLVI